MSLQIFYGIDETLQAVRNNKTINLVMDRTIKFVVLQLERKVGGGEVEERFATSLELSCTSFLSVNGQDSSKGLPT